MTSVKFYLSHDRIVAVDLLGHAGYAEEGEDIVCAAISSSVQLIHALLFDVLGIAVDTVVDDECAHIRLTLPDDRIEEGQAALKALYLHMTELEEGYSEFINVTEVYNHAED